MASQFFKKSPLANPPTEDALPAKLQGCRSKSMTRIQGRTSGTGRRIWPAWSTDDNIRWSADPWVDRRIFYPLPVQQHCFLFLEVFHYGIKISNDSTSAHLNQVYLILQKLFLCT